MKPSLTLHNDWRYVDGKYGDVNLLEFHFDWYSGASYYFTFRLLGFGFTVGLWDDAPPPPLTKQEEIARDIVRASLTPLAGRGLDGWVNAKPDYSEAPRKTVAWGVDDPEAHGIVHVGAQTATVTVEPKE